MPVVVLEGPDQSGKTTLAKMLYGELSRTTIPVEYQRSPVKELGWRSGYDTYLTDLTATSDGRIIIQDRVPEISETIYGQVMRGYSRCLGWAQELPHWMHNYTFFIFCFGTPATLMMEEDAEGNHIGREEHRTILTMYEDVYHQLSHMPLSPMQVVYYNRMRAGSWHYICRSLTEWLTRLFPQTHGLSEALNFAWDSKFPMPDEEEVNDL